MTFWTNLLQFTSSQHPPNFAKFHDILIRSLHYVLILSRKSYFEVVYSSVVRIGEDVKEKKELQKIILCEVQNEIFSKLEKILINMITDSGYPGIKFDKKVDFTKLFNEKFN